MRLLLCLATATALLLACGAGEKVTPTPTPRPSALDRIRATPQRVPQETPTPFPRLGGGTSVATSLSASCRQTADGPELVVDYGARVGGSTLRKVQLLDNGAVIDESGSISGDAVQRHYTAPAEPGSTHRLELMIDAPGTRPPTALLSTTCPALPGQRF